MDRNEATFKNFLIEKIEKTGGSAQIRYLNQLLSSLSYDVRSSVASNQVELMRFLRKYPDTFQVDANGNVRLQSTNLHETDANDDDDDRSVKRFVKTEPSDDLPRQLNDGEGVVIKIHPTFGFIAAKSPLKTQVYFSPASFGNEQVTLLTDIDKLHIGAKVGFYATKQSNEHSTKYRAKRVWFIKSEEDGNRNKFQNDCEPKSRKTRETGKYDAGVNEGEGKILKLSPTFGFIIIDNDKNNTVFFYKSNLAKYENVVDLNKVLKVGDLVEFKAVRTAEKKNTARWSATQVWIKKSINAIPNTKGSADLQNVAPKKQHLKNQTGKIYPHSKGIVIKFGSKFENIADADSSIFYMLGTKVMDVSWEFSDGDNVRFDAVEIKSHPGWKATLVWTGERPKVVTAPDLGDFSEFADDIDDTASTISKVSDNSIFSENSSRSYQPPLSRSSGYSSMRQSQENLQHFSVPPSRNSSSIETRSYIDMDVEDISDTTSCYSRSSDKSAGVSGRGFSRNSRAQRRRSSNQKKKYSNQDLRHDNMYNSSNSYSENWRTSGNRNSNSHQEKRQRSLNRNPDLYHRRQESLNRNSSSYHERRQESLNRNSSSYGERRQESLNRNSSSYGERGQESLNRNSSSYDERGQESLDRNSNSYNGKRQGNVNRGSNPYQEKRQGTVNQKPNSYQDRRPDMKKRSSSVGKNSAHQNVERFKRYEEILQKYIVDTPKEPEDDNISTISDSSKSDVSFKDSPPETKTYINWADTPYPGEDDDLEIDDDAEKDDIETEKAATQNSAKDSIDDASVINQDEVYNSEDEFSDAVEERAESLPLDEPLKLLAANDDLSTDAKEEKVPTKCSVKIFKEIEGTMKKVHCKYGTIICPLLPQPANFFWQDVYHNEIPVSDRYDDLREFLKVGDVLKFNCIRVVDEEECNFIKCTMLWKGKKPNIVEMTPQQYIASEKLKVFLKDDNYEIEVVSPSNPTPANAPPEQPKRKFLVTVNSEDSDSEAEASASAAKPLPNSSEHKKVSDVSLNESESGASASASAGKPLPNRLLHTKVSNLCSDESESDAEASAPVAKPLSNRSVHTKVSNLCSDESESDAEASASAAKPLPNRSVHTKVSNISSDESESDAEASASAAKPLPNRSVRPKVPKLSSDESGNEAETNSNKNELIEGISKIIKYGGLPSCSRVDLTSVSSEILNFVLNMCAVKKLEAVNQSVKETQTIDYTLPESVPTSVKSDEVKIKSTATQTIFTGDVRGNNIYTE